MLILFHIYLIVAMKNEMKIQKIKKNRDVYATKWDLNTENFCLMNISPALNVLFSRPDDPAHSEYSEMSKQMYVKIFKSKCT